MHTTVRSFRAPGAARVHSGPAARPGLTDPAVIEAFVSRRVEDPSLLTQAAGPSYGDFFRAPAE
jgi:hypothetical protein